MGPENIYGKLISRHYFSDETIVVTHNNDGNVVWQKLWLEMWHNCNTISEALKLSGSRRIVCFLIFQIQFDCTWKSCVLIDTLEKWEKWVNSGITVDIIEYDNRM